MTTEIWNLTFLRQIQMNKKSMKICSKICKKVALMKMIIANIIVKIKRSFNHNLQLEKTQIKNKNSKTKEHHNSNKVNNI